MKSAFPIVYVKYISHGTLDFSHQFKRDLYIIVIAIKDTIDSSDGKAVTYSPLKNSRCIKRNIRCIYLSHINL